MFVEYRIPLENCSKFLAQQMTGVVKVKYLRARSDACLSHKSPVCKVEIYYPRQIKPVLYDDKAFELGGTRTGEN